MDFILNEAIQEDDEFKLVFSDDSEGEFSKEEQELNFIDDNEGEEQEEASFYRNVDNNERVRFSNQTRNPDKVVNESEDEYYGEDDMPELFDPEKREDVEFHLFDNYSDKSQIFENSFLRFGDVDNQLFYAVLYGIMYCKLSGLSVELQFAERVLGSEFFIELKKIKKSTVLDLLIFVFFDRCQVINEILSEYGFFL